MTMKMETIRLRALRGGAVNMYVRGVKFAAGEWTEVPEVLALEGGGEFPLVAYVSSLRDMEDRPLFELAAAAPAQPPAEVEAAAPEIPAEEGTTPPDEGKEAFTSEQREAELAERAAIEAAQGKGADAGKADAEGADGAAPAPDGQPTGRRAQRLARRKTAKEPATG